MLILVTGKTGAGKTTFSTEYKSRACAKVFSIDSWMKSLYWQDMPNEPDMKWFVENQKWYTDRISRCEKLIENELIELIESGAKIDILLDLGFTSTKHRMYYVNLAKKLGVKTQIYYIDLDSQTRWQRVQNRNIAKKDTYTMHVTKDMFNYIEEIFEEFSEIENKILKRI